MKVFIQLTVEIEPIETPGPTKEEMAASARQAVVFALLKGEDEGFTHNLENVTSLHIDPDDVRVLSTDPE